MTKELRNKKLSLCFTDAEYEEIRARAELMGVPVARLARELISFDSLETIDRSADLAVKAKEAVESKGIKIPKRLIEAKLIDIDNEPKIEIRVKVEEVNALLDGRAPSELDEQGM